MLKIDGAALLLRLAPAMYVQVYCDGTMIHILNMPNVVQGEEMPMFEWDYTVEQEGDYKLVVGGVLVGDTPVFSVAHEGHRKVGDQVKVRWALEGVVDALT